MRAHPNKNIEPSLTRFRALRQEVIAMRDAVALLAYLPEQRQAAPGVKDRILQEIERRKQKRASAPQFP